MAKKTATTQTQSTNEPTTVDQNITNQISNQSTHQKDSIVQSTIDNTPDTTTSTPIVKTNTIVDKKDNTTNSNINVTVVRIIQKRPSHYSLLMSDGTQKVVHKSMFDRSTMTILTDK